MKSLLRTLLLTAVAFSQALYSGTPFDEPNFNPSTYGGYVVRDPDIQSYYDEENADKDENKEHNSNPAVNDKELEKPRPEIHHSGHYRLKPGDRLDMAVYGDPHTRRLVQVDYNGTLSYLFITTFPVLGKTISEVRTELEQLLTAYYREPMLLITLAESTGDFYTISGEVANPGIKPLIGNTTILSAIAESNGLILRFFRDKLIEIGDLDHAFLSRKGEYVPVNFENLIRYGDMSQNIPLKHGDYIYIPSRETHQIFILGEVITPITFEYFRTMTLTEAIAEAGGVNRRASSRVIVIRGSLACPTRYLVDVNLIWKGCARDFILQPGDIVYVPIMQFQCLKELFKIAVRAFVSQAFNVMGSNAYLRLNPDAIGLIDTPVPVIGTTPVVAPAPVGGP